MAKIHKINIQIHLKSTFKPEGVETLVSSNMHIKPIKPITDHENYTVLSHGEY